MTREEFENILEEYFIEGYNQAISDIQEDILDEEAYDLEGEYEYYTESSNKKYYAVVSSTNWSSVFLSGGLSIGTFMIPLGAIARTASATAHESLDKAIYNWIKYNSMRGFKVDEKKKTIYIDKKWYDKEKNTDVIVLTAPEKSTFKGVFSDKTIGSPYQRHGGTFSGGDSLDYKFFKNTIEKNMKESGVTSTEMSFEHACKKAGIKIKFEDFSINPLNAINIWKKANGLGESYDLEKDYEYYNEAWKPSEFKSKEAEEEAKKHKAGFFNLGKNKADFVRTHTIPKLYEKLKNGSTFGGIAKEVDTENKAADKYYKPGHAGHQLNDYAHRVSRYLLHKAKNSKK